MQKLHNLWPLQWRFQNNKNLMSLLKGLHHTTDVMPQKLTASGTDILWRIPTNSLTTWAETIDKQSHNVNKSPIIAQDKKWPCTSYENELGLCIKN